MQDPVIKVCANILSAKSDGYLGKSGRRRITEVKLIIILFEISNMLSVINLLRFANANISLLTPSFIFAIYSIERTNHK